jgi:hypothetical protein
MICRKEIDEAMETVFSVSYHFHPANTEAYLAWIVGNQARNVFKQFPIFTHH